MSYESFLAWLDLLKEKGDGSPRYWPGLPAGPQSGEALQDLHAEMMHFPLQKLPSALRKPINIGFTVALNTTLKPFPLQYSLQ